MTGKIRKKIRIFLWNITPRVYICRDVYLVKWVGKEYIIKRNKKNFL